MELSKAFKKGPEAIQKLIAEFQKEFGEDGNIGLAKQIQKAVVKRNIQRLTSTYVTLSLEDIAKRAKLKSPAEAEQYVLGMIQDGDIIAKINQQKGMISFLEVNEEYDTSVFAAKLDAKVKEVVSLTTEVKAKDKELVLSPAYVALTMPQDDDFAGMMTSMGGGRLEEERQFAQALAASQRMS